jgi:hypothetical protein
MSMVSSGFFHLTEIRDEEGFTCLVDLILSRSSKKPQKSTEKGGLLELISVKSTEKEGDAE